MVQIRGDGGGPLVFFNLIWMLSGVGHEDQLGDELLNHDADKSAVIAFVDKGDRRMEKIEITKLGERRKLMARDRDNGHMTLVRSLAGADQIEVVAALRDGDDQIAFFENRAFHGHVMHIGDRLAGQAASEKTVAGSLGGKTGRAVTEEVDVISLIDHFRGPGDVFFRIDSDGVRHQIMNAVGIILSGVLAFGGRLFLNNFLDHAKLELGQ